MDFTKQRFDEQKFGLVGRGASVAIDRKTGIIHLPLDRPGQTQVGIGSRFRTAGDFEVTAGFEIIGLEQPKDGYGSGVALRLIKPGEPNQRAVFSCLQVSSKGDIVRTDVMDLQDQKITHRVEGLPGKVRKGRLRVARTGTTVSFLISEQMQGEGSFRLLRQMSFGDEDVESVALLADTGGSRSRLTALLISLVVRADRLPFGEPTRPQPRSQPRSSWWGVAVVAALAGAVALAGWVIHRRRRRGPTTRPASPRAARPGEGERPRPKETTSPGGTGPAAAPRPPRPR